MAGQRQRAPAWFAFGGFGVLGMLGFICLLYGLKPGYQLEQSGIGHIPDASVRCPASRASDSEAGYDLGCEVELTSRGPLALGVPALATAFLLGLMAIGCLGFRGGRARITAWIMLALYLTIWLLMLRWNAGEGRRLRDADVAAIASRFTA